MWHLESAISEDENIYNGFCINTISKLCSEDSVTTLPVVRGVVENKTIVLSIDKSLFILEIENITNIVKDFCFDSQIDAVSISTSGDVIICALNNGHIHGVFARGYTLFDVKMEEHDINSSNEIIGIDRVSHNNFLIFNSNGSIYFLSNIDESQLYSSKTVTGENMTFEDGIEFTDVKLTKLPHIFSLNEISSYCYLNFNCNLKEDQENYMFISGNKDFIKYQNEKFTTKMFLQKDYNGVKKFFNLNSYIVALTNSGEIFEICPYTRTLFSSFTKDFNYVIRDLVVMEASNESIELLLLCKSKDNDEFSIKVVNFPSFKVQSEIFVSNSTWIINQAKGDVNMYYLNGTDVNINNFCEEIEIKLVKETQPEERIKKLIQKGHLDEAEDFGKQYNLNLQPVYKARVRKYLLEISNLTENNLETMEIKFQKLVKVLNLIKDKNFFHEIRFITIPSRRFYLMYLETLLSFLDDNFSEYIVEIKEQQLRLKTLDIIDPYECNSDWQDFIQHPNIVKVCVSLFSRDMSTACIIWQRHSASIVPYLDEKTIRKILDFIPSTIEAFSIIQWLRCLIPSVVQIFPSSMIYLVEWCIKKTRSLQFSNYWPAIGLEFATKILDIFENVNFLHSDIHRQYDISMENLRNLTHILEDLLILKNCYNLVLTLNNYEKDSIHKTTLGILERIQTSMLKNLVRDFLYPIYREKGKSPINAIIEHIDFLIANRNGFTAWIERSVILIDLLHNEEEKLKSALHVLRFAPVPWPETVKPLINLRNSSNAIADEINTLCNMQVVEAIKIKHGWATNTADSTEKLLYRILKMDLPDMFKDIKDLTQANPTIRMNAYFYCCFELATTGKVDRAIEFLNSLDEHHRSICSEKIIIIATNILEENEDNENENKSIFKLMKSIISFVGKEEKKQIQIIENILLLRKKFNIQIQFQELFNKNYRKSKLKHGISFIIEKINKILNNENNEINVVNLIWRDMNQLTNALMFDNMYGIILLSKTVNNINLSCALAYNSIELHECTVNNVNLFIEFAILIIYQQLCLDREQSYEFEDSLSFPIVFELFKKSMSHIPIYEIKHILKWVRIGLNVYGAGAVKNIYSLNKNINDILVRHFKSKKNDYMDKNAKTSKKRESLSIFDEPTDKHTYVNPLNSKLDPQPILRCLSLALIIILTETDPEDNNLRKLKEYVLHDPKSLSNSLADTFYSTFEHLIKSKQHEYWYKISQFLMEDQEKFQRKIISPFFLSKQLKKMFRDLLTQKYPDFSNLFAMLICDPDPKEFLKILFIELKNEQQKINFFCLSERYFALINDTEKVIEQRQCRLKYFYFSELRRQDPEQVKNRDIELMQFDQLKNELRTKILNINLLEKFCDDFDLNYQMILISQIINVLEKQVLDFDIKTDQFGKEELYVKTCAEDIRSACQPYINKIVDHKDLVDTLVNYIPKINSYFYELFLCVFKILISSQLFDNNVVKRFEVFCGILLFLKHKMILKRKSRPSDNETESWLNNQTDKSTLSKIAKYRLPFSFFFAQQSLNDILKNDIDIDNCASWFPLITLYSQICSIDNISHTNYIIIQTIKRAIMGNIKDFGTWQLTPVNNAFLNSVLRLCKYITDKSMVLSILYSLTNNAPEGADQVEAAYECYKFATENENELLKMTKTNPNEELIKKIKRKYPMLKIQHLLHFYNLIEDKFLQLIENPKELIIALYHHDIILKTRKPNINQLAKEISILGNINLLNLQYTLIEKWLSSSGRTDVHEIEETFYENSPEDTMHDEEINNFTTEFVIRSHYILSSWEPNKAKSFLILNVFPSDGVVNVGKQLQAFECFCKLMDGTNINEDYLEIMDQQQFIIIKCVYNLKELGFNFTIEKFKKYDKLMLLKKIWQNYFDKNLAMEIIANICIGFDIHEPKIWNGVLKQMCNMNMLKELNALVEHLSCKRELLHTDGLKLAWEYILKEPFKHANRSRSVQQEEILSKNLFRLQGCPLVDKLNLIEMAEDCILLDRPHMAAILIGLCNTKQIPVIKDLVNSHMSNKVRDDILELGESGILQCIINKVLKVLEL